MPARNEIVPLDATASGPARGAVPATPAHKPKSKSTFTNAEALSSQERRTQLVLAQKRHSNFQLFYALFGLALMVVQMEYLWFANTKSLAMPCPVHAVDQCPRCLDSLDVIVPIQDGRMILHALRVLISFSTAILLYYIYRYYAAECEVMKIKNIVPPQATLLSSSLRRNLLFELLVLCIHPFPGLEAVDPRWPNLVVATSLLMFCRIGLVLRAVQARSSFNSSNGWFIGALTNVDFTAAFFVKSTLKNHPSRWLVLCAAVLILVAGYSLYVVERFLCAFAHDSCCEPLALVDALWTLIMTALTIGYGDIVPHTAPGRLLAVATGALGTLGTAVTIAVISNHLVLTRSEHKVNAFLKKDDNRRLINDHAARTIQAFVQFIGCQRRHHHGLNSKRGRAAIRRSEVKLYNVLQAYRQVKRHVNSHDVSDPMDKQMTMLEMMEVNVEYIRTKIEDLSELFHNQANQRNGGAGSSSKRKLSNHQLAINASPPAERVPQPTSSVIAQQMQQQQQEVAARSASRTGSVVNDLGLNHSGGSSRHLAIGVSGGSTSGNGSIAAAALSTPPSVVAAVATTAASSQATQLQSGPPAQFTAMATGAIASRTTSPSPERIMHAHQLMRMNSSSRNLRSEGDDMPEWAIVLETTLQSILTQVGRVSSEVESIKARVNEHIDDMDARVSAIEKKLTVQNAFREITRTASKSELFKRNSFGTNAGGHTSVSDAGLSSNGSTSIPPQLSVPLRGSRRTLLGGDQRRPSIRNFLTQKDLDEFQNGDTFE